MAAPVSEHNEEHTAYNAAIQILVERGCTPKFTRTKRYVVDATADAVTIISKQVSQQCKSGPVAHVITWAAPTADELNRPLPPDAIAGYELTVNGELVAFTASTEYRAEGLKPGDIVGLLTVGSTGLKSKEAFKDVP